MQTLLEQNATDNGTYAEVQPSQWFGTGAGSVPCSSASVSGTYAAQFKNICSAIVANESGGNSQMYFFVGNQVLSNTKYSILTWVQSKGQWLCLGSDQGSSYNSGDWVSSGCWADPNL